MKPDYVEALNNRANALLSLKRFEEALAGCDRTLAVKPDLAEALIIRGHALSDLKRPGSPWRATTRRSQSSPTPPMRWPRGRTRPPSAAIGPRSADIHGRLRDKRRRPVI